MLFRSYSHVDKAFYVGQSNKQYFIKNGLHNNQLIYAPHSIDNKRFYDVDSTYETKAKIWREKLMIPSSAVVFLFAGKLEPKKNPLLLIHAYKYLNRPDVFLIIAGNGVLEKSLKKESESNPNIIFIDFQNQQIMPVVYRLGDIFILPSKGPGET